MADTIANSLNTLFESDLFKENNFIKIYNLLGIHSNVGKIQLQPAPVAPAPVAPPPVTAPPPVAAPAVTTPVAAPVAVAAPPPVVTGGLKDTIISNNYIDISYKLINGTISIYNKIPIFSDLNISIEQKKTIIDSIINDNITKDINSNTVILDPAGLNYMKGIVDKNVANTTNHVYANQTLSGGGLSGQLYKLIKNKTIPKTVFDFYTTKIYQNLYDKPITVSIYNSYNDNTFNIIHSLGPDFSDPTPLNYTIVFIDNNNLLQLFTDIYDNILNIFNIEKNKTPNLKLRLCALSAGIFSSDYKQLILCCIAYVYINLWKNYKDYISLYLYDVDSVTSNPTPEQETYNYVKKIIEYTIPTQNKIIISLILKNKILNSIKTENIIEKMDDNSIILIPNDIKTLTTTTHMNSRIPDTSLSKNISWHINDINDFYNYDKNVCDYYTSNFDNLKINENFMSFIEGSSYAFYHQKDADTVKTNDRIKKYNIIHILSPNLNTIIYTTDELIKLYTKIYNDVITKYIEKKFVNSKLLLVPISLGNNAGERENEILDILVSIYINLFISNSNIVDDIKLYIYRGPFKVDTARAKELYEYFKKSIESIIEVEST